MDFGFAGERLSSEKDLPKVALIRNVSRSLAVIPHVNQFDMIEAREVKVCVENKEPA